MLKIHLALDVFDIFDNFVSRCLPLKKDVQDLKVRKATLLFSTSVIIQCVLTTGNLLTGVFYAEMFTSFLLFVELQVR